MLVFPLTFYFFIEKNVLSSIVFAAVISISDYTIRKKHDKISELLNQESRLVIPLLLLVIVLVYELSGVFSLQAGIIDFVQKILIGIGLGIIFAMGIILVLKQVTNKKVSVIILLISVFISYFLSGSLSGNGIVTLVVFGFIYANFLTKNKAPELRFNNILADVFSIPLFILLGYMIPIRSDMNYMQYSIIFFLLLLLLRIVSVFISHSHDSLVSRQKIILSFAATRSQVVAAVVLYLSFLDSGFNILTYVVTLILIFNLILVETINFIETRKSN
jgi:NhaP-type Na+/H+ or K+/H+ antiporter